MKDFETRYAHTPPFPGGPWHTIREHLGGVHDLAIRFAVDLGLADFVALAAWLHDLGKYGDLFQRRLRNLESGIDHWTAGAYVALSRFACVEAALAIQGHHVGLQAGDLKSLKSLDLRRYSDDRRRLSETDGEWLLERLAEDGVALPSIPKPDRAPRGVDGMLRTRMLFSALVDADFLDTESHFARKDSGPKVLRPEGPALDPERALRALDDYRERLPQRATPQIAAMRKEVWDACGAAAARPAGLFTLTAPTGSGKTLAMLRFALLHAKKHGLRRIVVVLPYLTLIEQTAAIYREVFDGFGENFVLEDHSLVTDVEGKNEESRAKLLAENWDAPIVITTSVRFFEALHHNRPSVCRKLHRLARSVVLCDEVQTLPLGAGVPASMKPQVSAEEGKAEVNLIVPTLATVASLSRDFGASVVFATATQPAFETLQGAIRRLCPHDWRPGEIMPDVPRLFAESARVRAEWRLKPQSLEEIAQEVSLRPGTLTILNTRAQAAQFTALLRKRRPDAVVVHLSTNLCVAHRRQVLDRIRDEDVEREGFLVATQCVEAGVDLDFKQVYRAWAPLDSIAQAAGRGNRNGRFDGARVVVFLPDPAHYPPGYGSFAEFAKVTVQAAGVEDAALHDPVLYRAFFERLYDARGLAEAKSVLEERIVVQHYADVAKLYRLIPQVGVNVVVNVGDRLGPVHRAENEKLLAEVREGLTGGILRKLRPYTVNVFYPEDLPLQPLKLRKPSKTMREEDVPNWFLCDNPACYDAVLGLLARAPGDALHT